MKKIRNILLAVFFSWWAVAGVLVTGLFSWLLSLSLTVSQVIGYGTLGGVVTGAVLAMTAWHYIRKKFRHFIQGSRLAVHTIRIFENRRTY